MARLVHTVTRSVDATLRFELVISPQARDAMWGGPVIFATWHNRLALSLMLYRRYITKRQPSRRLATMVSASRDGGMLAYTLKLFGVESARGSTSRRGPQALLEMTSWAEKGYDLAITPDGPRGPRYVLQDGVVSVARVTGLSIIPIGVHVVWKKEFSSWDRFQFPLPFSKVICRVAEPLRIPRDATDRQRGELRRELERRMKEITVD